MTVPTPADPEVAAIVFASDLRAAVESVEGRRRSWCHTDLDDLNAVVHLTAHGASADEYHLLLNAQYYDLWPARGVFAEPPADGSGGWVEATPTSSWLPHLDQQQTSPWFALHPTYPYPELPGFRAGSRQLLCCSMSFDYYISNHAPTEDQRWVQGKHKVHALISRMADVLDGPAYLGRTQC